MSGGVKTFSFAEIVRDRDAAVRITDDGYFYAVDLAMVMTGKDRDHAGQAIRGVTSENSLSIKMIERQLSTHGGPKTKLVSFKDAIQLVMVLPGKVAKETRAQFASIIERYLAGDKTLHAEIDGNAESSSPIAQLARASLEGNDGESALKRRKIHDAEVAKMELENARMAAENQQLAISNQKMAYELYAMACHDGKPDDRIRLLFKDNMYNLMAPAASSGSTSANALITAAGESESMMMNRPITISTVATELGLRFTSDELKRIGGLVRKRYMQRHGEPPGKHEQLVGGSVRHVNSYTAKDRDLVEAVLREWHDDAGDDA